MCNSIFRPVWIVAPWTLLLVLMGCSQEALPKTYVVKGKCVQKSGKPLQGGFITFTSIADPELRGYGEISKDGTFTRDTVALRKNATSEKLAGAVEGEFHVNIRPDSGSTDGGPPIGGGKPAFTLKKTYQIEAKELNEITVIVE
ncbi:MAG: hypothetical protein ABL921_02955 [Pirellula sp.]